MPRYSKSALREISLEEEEPLRKEFLAGLKKRGWKKAEIEAAEGGWEYAFDVGFDHPESDGDAARDMAEGMVELGARAFGQRKMSDDNLKELIADLIYHGIGAARKVQSTPAPEAKSEG